MAVDDFDQFVDDVVTKGDAPVGAAEKATSPQDGGPRLDPPLLTTETLLSTRYRVVTTLPMVRARRVQGSATWRGGVENVQEQFAEMESAVFGELQQKAKACGANAVVRVQFQCGEISGSGKPLFYMTAQGTPVIVREVNGAANPNP